jgi:hypothetical protein
VRDQQAMTLTPQLEAEGANLKQHIYSAGSNHEEVELPTGAQDDLDEAAHLQLHPLKDAGLAEIFPVLALFCPLKKGKGAQPAKDSKEGDQMLSDSFRLRQQRVHLDDLQEERIRELSISSIRSNKDAANGNSR